MAPQSIYSNGEASLSVPIYQMSAMIKLLFNFCIFIVNPEQSRIYPAMQYIYEFAENGNFANLGFGMGLFTAYIVDFEVPNVYVPL